MFGWEFPPEISGGLGTACFGLTKALTSENVDVTFVAPRLSGAEDKIGAQFLSASEVDLPLPGEKHKRVKVLHEEEEIVLRQREPRIIAERSVRNVTKVLVESPLDPYAQPSVTRQSWPIESWNYVLEQQAPYPEKTTRMVEREEIVTTYRYSFKGGYGESLVEEVKEYARAAGEIARRFEHDLIHVHDWMTFRAGIAAKEISGKPLIVHVHATEFDRSGCLYGQVFEIEKEGLDAADHIVAVSNWTKEILVNRYGIVGAKISVIHNGIFRSPCRSKELPVTGSHVVTFLGRITHQKGPAYFVEAARKVAERFQDAHFIVAGSGDLLPQTIERVAQLRLSQKFHFTGFLNREYIERIWSISSVYVMPSVSEPFGITPLEAIQAGVPVIISNQSGVAEVMPDALKVDFWDIDALAEAICSVLNYESLSKMLSRRGDRQIDNLSWNHAAQKLKTLYDEKTTKSKR